MTRTERWDRHYLELARFWADLVSKDPSTKVGAVVVSADGKREFLGYNGFPRGVLDLEERLNDRPQKYARVVHAELNAILKAGREAEGGTLYCTLFCCNECAKAIIQSGIRRVVTPAPESGRWDDAHKISREMFEEAGVEVAHIV